MLQFYPSRAPNLTSVFLGERHNVLPLFLLLHIYIMTLRYLYFSLHTIHSPSSTMIFLYFHYATTVLFRFSIPLIYLFFPPKILSLFPFPISLSGVYYHFPYLKQFTVPLTYYLSYSLVFLPSREGKRGASVA